MKLFVKTTVMILSLIVGCIIIAGCSSPDNQEEHESTRSRPEPIEIAEESPNIDEELSDAEVDSTLNELDSVFEDW